MKLLVIGEVDIVDAVECRTRNVSMNRILLEYLTVFDTVVYLGPGKENCFEIRKDNGLIMVSTNTYSKRLMSRLRFLFSFRAIRQLDGLLKQYRPNWVQIRIPSIFGLRCGFYITSKYPINTAIYLAGDWEESIYANYAFPGSTILGMVLDRIQRTLLHRSVVVTAGGALKEKIANITNAYAFYSTTHDKIVKSDRNKEDIIVSLGRLEKLKRFDLTIYALEELNDILGRKYKLLILGDGPERESLEALAVELGVREQVEFLGYIGKKKYIEKILLDAKYLVHPSASEGSAKVLPEAMAFGVIPLAVEGVGSNNQILKEIPGTLVEPTSNSIAKAIAAYEGNRSLYGKARDAGYKYAKNHTLTKEVVKMWDWVFANCRTKGSSNSGQ